MYLWVYRLIKKRANGSEIIDYEILKNCLRRPPCIIPKEILPIIIKECENYKLVRKLNKQKYELTGGDKDKLLPSAYRLMFI